MVCVGDGVSVEHIGEYCLGGTHLSGSLGKLCDIPLLFMRGLFLWVIIIFLRTFTIGGYRDF